MRKTQQENSQLLLNSFINYTFKAVSPNQSLRNISCAGKKYSWFWSYFTLGSFKVISSRLGKHIGIAIEFIPFPMYPSLSSEKNLGYFTAFLTLAFCVRNFKWKWEHYNTSHFYFSVPLIRKHAGMYSQHWAKILMGGETSVGIRAEQYNV